MSLVVTTIQVELGDLGSHEAEITGFTYQDEEGKKMALTKVVYVVQSVAVLGPKGDWALTAGDPVRLEYLGTLDPETEEAYCDALWDAYEGDSVAS